ncbi:cytochrome c biogenesis protein CcsA [Candidatus Halobeggiatoa sp. HSG11]|nr:cytochrome c biogenesis protein CcsA [Candidatus Halobeggiatoa sp. HSG11]
METVNIFAAIAIFFYIIASFTKIYQVASKHILLLFGGLAIICHALVLQQSMITPLGLNLGFFNAASMMAWVIAMLLLLSVLRQPVENLIIILFPVAALAIGLEIYFPTERILPSDTQFGVTLHVLLSIIAYSLLTISAIQALFLALQDHRLRHKHPGWVLKKLPPLQIMETLLFQMIGIGFIFLSLSLLSGIIFLQDIFAQHLVHKTTLSIIAWFVFAILLWGHWHYGWRSKTVIRWTIGGFSVLMLAYFGSKMVLELILNHGY